MRGRSLAGALVVLGLLASCSSEIEHEAGQDSNITAADAPAHDAKTDALVAALDTDRMKTQLTKLVGFGTRNSTNPIFTQVLAYCEDEMKALGYTPTRQSVTVSGKETFNLIWEKKGTTDDAVLVTAHVDSINQEFSGSQLAPGADDNGSGSVGTMELARVLATESPKQTIRFILWTGEEEGLYGSAKYVKSLTAAEKAKIKAVINMDMIATQNGTGAPGVLLEGASLSQFMIDGLSKAAATYTTLAVKTSLRPFNSDHVSFINAGIPSVLTIEGNDSANRNMHTHNDTLDKIDWALMKSILTMNLAYLASATGIAGTGTTASTDAGAPPPADAGSADAAAEEPTGDEPAADDTQN